MQTRRIGSLEVSVVGLGCNNFGGRLDQARTTAVIDAAIDAGITLLDTADIYGATRSEEFLGKALAGRRDRVVLATKFGMAIDDARSGARPDYVRRALDDSLRRLATDRIDLYQLHKPDPETPIADTLGALADLVTAGKIRELGCSNFSVAQLREARTAAGTGARFVSVQNEYSVLHREPEPEVLAECVAQELAFLPFFPLAGGALTGKYRRHAPAPAGARLTDGGRLADRFLTDASRDRIERLEALAAEHGRSVLDLAIGWLLARAPVASVIAGATSADQIHANVAAGTWQLEPEVLAAVDVIAPAARPA